MGKASKEYVLKQHSPIIHFQHNQNNATLRATELKPRLDDLLNNQNHDKRYKIRLIAKGNQPQKDHRLYFGNMSRDKSEKNKKHCSRVKGKLILQINTFFNRALLAEIEQKLSACLAIHNFGARQTKGFGSFYFDQAFDNANPFDPIEHINQVYRQAGLCVFYFDIQDNYKKQEDLDFAIFNHIQALYQAMKPGINEEFKVKNSYLKSLLWQYFDKEHGPINWEKRMMKRMLIKKPIHQNDIPNYYIRGLLGLANTFEFRKTKYPARMDQSYDDHDTFSIRRNETFKINHRQIKRFESPITFKPINKRVYIILDENLCKKIQGQTFTFTHHTGSFDLSVPDEDIFSLESFMDFVRKKINNRDFGPFTGKTDTARILKNMTIEKL